jgi:DNA-binding SARP family transcriptional activator
VHRERLVRRLERCTLGLVVAGGGYGKTQLAIDLSEKLGLASVFVLLSPDDTSPAALVTRIVAALERAHLTETAAAVRSERASSVIAVEALSRALAREREPVLVVVDDAHHLGPDAGDVLGRLARDLPPEHRLLVLARRPLPFFPPAGRELTVALRGDDLGFSSEEVADLASSFGIELLQADVETLRRATGGWAAALVLAAERLVRCPDPEGEVQRIARQQQPLRYLLGRQLEGLDEASATAVAQLAHLPLLSPALVEAVAGDKRLLERATAAGIPFGPRSDGWWDLPGPVQELLQRKAPLEGPTALVAAEVYRSAGELAEALHVLLRAGEAQAAAALLATLSPQEADDLGYFELRTLLDAIPAGSVESQPRALLHLARACEPAAQTRLRAQTLERVLTLARGRGDGELVRAVQAERCRDLVRDGQADEAEAQAAGLLEATGPGELSTRARLLDVLGRAAAWRRDARSLTRAEQLLREALVLCQQLGERSWASQVVMPLAHGVHYCRGHHEQALELIKGTLAELPGRSHQRGVILSFYGDILVNCGRFQEAEAVVEEGRYLGTVLQDRRVLAYAAWTGAMLASQLGDAGRTLTELRSAEAQYDDWFDHSTGADFLADAADLADRVGERGAALAYLERARARRDEAPLAVAIAEAAVAARSGDPNEALAVLDRLASMPRFEPRERWRLSLLRAYATLRLGGPEAGPLAARAFDEAAALGKAFLPLVRERAVAERLVGLAAAAGSRAAAQLQASGRPLSIALLGRFEVRQAGQLVTIPVGKPQQLVKLLALSGGRVPAEVAIEELWPEVEPSSGRKRLRNVLNRLRSAGPALVARQGEVLVLADAEVDADVFEDEARAVLDHRDTAIAGLVLSRYRGTLLPDDRYEEWAAAPRERVERTFVALLDAAAGAAEARGSVDEALRYLDRAMDLDQYDEDRYLRAARLLLGQGRRGAALRLLQRAERALGRLGVPTSDAHRRLSAAVRA